MTKFQDPAVLIARILMALLFIVAGLGKLGNIDGITGYMASAGVPTFLVWPVILFEVLGGLAILAGWQTRMVALGFVGFCLLTALLFHLVPADQAQMTNFFKNVALSGGFLSLAMLGAGRYSLDAKAGRASAIGA